MSHEPLSQATAEKISCHSQVEACGCMLFVRRMCGCLDVNLPLSQASPSPVKPGPALAHFGSRPKALIAAVVNPGCPKGSRTAPTPTNSQPSIYPADPQKKSTQNQFGSLTLCNNTLTCKGPAEVTSKPAFGHDSARVEVAKARYVKPPDYTRVEPLMPKLHL